MAAQRAGPAGTGAWMERTGVGSARNASVRSAASASEGRTATATSCSASSGSSASARGVSRQHDPREPGAGGGALRLRGQARGKPPRRRERRARRRASRSVRPPERDECGRSAGADPQLRGGGCGDGSDRSFTRAQYGGAERNGCRRFGRRRPWGTRGARLKRGSRRRRRERRRGRGRRRIAPERPDARLRGGPCPDTAEA